MVFKGFIIMPLIKKRFYIKCNGDECFKLAEIIKTNMVSKESTIIIKDNGIVIELYGYKTDIKNTWLKIKRLLSIYKATYSREGRNVYPLEHIVSLSRKTFPPRLLVEILKYQGYMAEYKDGNIISNADLEHIVKLVNRINELINDLRYTVKGTTSKYFLVAASILLNTDPMSIIEHSLNKGLMIQDQDGKPCLRVEWRQALSKILRSFAKPEVNSFKPD